MSRNKKLSTLSLLGEVTQHLGIDGAGEGSKKKKTALSRKDKRKLERQQKKENKKLHTTLRPSAPRHELKAAKTEPEARLYSKQPVSGAEGAPKKKKAKTEQSADFLMDDPEDAEIARLEKLLGLKKDENARRKVAAKLNKEYAQFEGLGDDFGDFLLGLDDIAKTDRPMRGNEKYYEDSDDAPSENEMGVVPDLLDDDEYPESDISYNEDEDEEEEEEGKLEGSADGLSDEEDMSGGSDEESGGSEEGSGDSDGDGHGGEGAPEYYSATRGQDIYGNLTGGEAAGPAASKYVPPHMRGKAAAVIDEKSEKYVTLRRVMNGLLNRLSDDSKDSIVRSMKDLFDSNSQQECCHCLNKCIMAACSNGTQVMVTLIPMYAAMVAALHISVGVSVGANLLELLAVTFHQEVHKSERAPREHALIGSKYAHNMLLLMMYLYSLRVVHHGLISGILSDLISVIAKLANNADASAACEGVVELLVSILESVGPQLNQDDPAAIRAAMISIADATRDSAVHGNRRMQYMLDAAAELKSNKSKRNPSAVMETMARLRKWLGTVKTSLGSKPGDPCLHITLDDFLNAEVKGRWWKAGAAWSGRTSENASSAHTAGSAPDRGQTRSYEQKSSATTSSEHTQLLALAAKMRMNTPVRRDIFVVMMSSMDPIDAYERIMRLDLKGKQDREIIKVLMECCGQEKTYNSFYAELGCILCEQNRQHKSTFQFAFWDAFKTLSEDNFSDRRAINLARLLGGLVASYHISLSILKVLDMSELSDRTILFLATLFLAILSSKVDDDTFNNIFDRVATTADYGAVRDVITFFLQKYFTDMPSGLEKSETKLLLQRRKKVLRIMSEMSVLDVAKGRMEESESAGKNKKRGRGDSF